MFDVTPAFVFNNDGEKKRVVAVDDDGDSLTGWERPVVNSTLA